MTAEEVYKMDFHEVSTSNLVIAYVGWPSLGVGQELEIACQHNIPILLIAEVTAKVSRMALGNPQVVKNLRFSNKDEFFDKLNTWLKKFDKIN